MPRRRTVLEGAPKWEYIGSLGNEITNAANDRNDRLGDLFENIHG